VNKMEHDHDHDHSAGKRLLALLLFIVTLPFVILGLVVFGTIYLLTTVLPSPVERLIYKKSEFYKDLGHKYTMSITHSFAYKSYKYVKQNENLELIVQSEGYYYYKSSGSILVLPYYAEYRYEDGRWLLSMKEGGDTIEPKDVAVTFQNLIKEDISGLELKLLVKEKYFKKDELLMAKKDPVFVFYKNQRDFATIKA